MNSDEWAKVRELLSTKAVKTKLRNENWFTLNIQADNTDEITEAAAKTGMIEHVEFYNTRAVFHLFKAEP